MPAYQDLTERALLDEQFGQCGIVLWGNLAIGIVTTLFYLALVDKWLILGWFAALLLILFIRLLLTKAYQGTEGAVDTIHRWLHIYAAGTLATGLCWAFLGVILVLTVKGEALFILFLALIGLTGGNIATSSYRKRLFVLFSTPVLLPVAVLALLSEDNITVTMGAFSLAMYLLSLIAVHRLNRSLINAITLDFENQTLIEELEQEKSRLQKTNQRLSQELQQKLSMTKWLAAGTASNNASIDATNGSNGSFTETLAELWETAIEHQQSLSLVIFQPDGQHSWPDDSSAEVDGNLTKLQNAICSEIRTADHFIRINKDEFAIIFSQMSSVDALSLVNRLREKLASNNSLIDKATNTAITLSFGIAGWVPNITQNAGELVTSSRRAKNLSIKNGGNQINLG